MAARVRELILEYTSFGRGGRTRSSYEARRSAVVDFKSSANGNETPLQAAHDRLRRGDLVGVLLENGADAKLVHPRCNALALALHHGQTETLRVLLRSGRHQAEERLQYGRGSNVITSGSFGAPARAVHLAVVPPYRPGTPVRPPPRIDALEALVREFGAEVNDRDQDGNTPLHWVVSFAAAPGQRERADDALVSLGADLDVRNGSGYTPLTWAAQYDASAVLRLLSLGASADLLTTQGISPLMWACSAGETIARVAVPALLRASSCETRRAVDGDGRSAIDRLARRGHYTEDWYQDVIGELLSSGVSVKPSNASLILSLAARHATHLERRVAARPHAPPPWQMHEAMVELAFDFQDARAAEEGVRVREWRVRELEEALRARGGEGGERQQRERRGGRRRGRR